MPAACISCKRLGRCNTTDAEKVLSNYVCDLYEEVERPEETKARQDIIVMYGEAGVTALVSPETEA